MAIETRILKRLYSRGVFFNLMIFAYLLCVIIFGFDAVLIPSMACMILMSIGFSALDWKYKPWKNMVREDHKQYNRKYFWKFITVTLGVYPVLLLAWGLCELNGISFPQIRYVAILVPIIGVVYYLPKLKSLEVV